MSETQIIISIVVPVYNVEKYLERCIESILSQTFQNFELILVDDGSTDKSPMICDEYALRDKRVHVIHKKNNGVSEARNTGLLAMQGQYVLFCDSDDYWSPEWAETLYYAAKEHTADLVSGGFTAFSTSGQVIGVKKVSNEIINLDSEEALKRYLICDILHHKLGWEVWTRIFRADIIKNHNIRFCTTCMNFAEDLGFVLEYSLYCKTIVSIDCCGYMYAQHDNSMMDTSKKKVKLNAVNEVSCQFADRIQKEKRKFLMESMPHVHYLIMNNQYSKLKSLDLMDEIGQEIDKISQKQWYLDQTKAIKRCKNELYRFYGAEEAKKIMLFSDYCMHRNMKKYQLKSFLCLKSPKIDFMKRIVKLILGEKNYLKLRKNVVK